MKRLILNIITILASFSLVTEARGQNIFEDVSPEEVTQNPDSIPMKLSRIMQWCKEKGVGTSLDAGISLGDMGIGLEVSTPVTKWTNVRVGVDWVPKFHAPLKFNLNTYVSGMPTGNFNHVADLVYNMTGIEIDETVNMRGTGSMINFKFLVDVFPVPSNRHWHITAGFYAGTSMFAKAVNTYDEKPTLVGLNIYNRAYEYFTNVKDIFNVPLGGGAYMDPDLVEKLQARFEKYGHMGIHIGDFKDGTPYIMEPAPDGTISARAYINHVKPYIGAGYSTTLDKNSRWYFGVDLGMLIWGGVPKVINHDYVTGTDINFTKDLVNIRGKVGDYVKVFKAFPVYPVVAIKISYNIL